MLNGKMGVLETGELGGDPVAEAPFAAVASAIADATGTLVSSRHPAGTQPCLTMSVSTMPEPVGSRWTTHQPRARDRITKVSPLYHRCVRSQYHTKKSCVLHNYVKFVLLLSHVGIYGHSVRHSSGGYGHIPCTRTGTRRLLSWFRGPRSQGFMSTGG
jgi:hypothetical protein